MGLERFHEAQAAEQSGYATALTELRAGSKSSHWIWYIFPQLAGLGRSPKAQHFGLHGLAEAADFVRDPGLRARYVEIAEVVEAQLRAGTPLTELMGGPIDAQKLASSLTLFRAAAENVGDGELWRLTSRLLEHTTAAGFAPCAATLAHVRPLSPG